MKCISLILAVGFCCILRDFVNGMSHIEQYFHLEPENKTKKYECPVWFGCWNGYCWVGCEHLGYRVGYGEWCYSGRPDTPQNSYTKCKSKLDCSNCWECTGNCDPFYNF